jgi:iron complex outermembrane receptor protein
MWGANAVNGVINIITKHSAETLGGYADFGVGN